MEENPIREIREIRGQIQPVAALPSALTQAKKTPV
jgi:hypothetical protein